MQITINIETVSNGAIIRASHNNSHMKIIVVEESGIYFIAEKIGQAVRSYMKEISPEETKTHGTFVVDIGGTDANDKPATQSEEVVRGYAGRAT